MSVPGRLDLALDHLDRVQSFHGRIDARVAVVFALDVGMAAITVTNLPKSVLHTCLAIPAIVALGCIAASLVFLMMTSYSHLATKSRPSLLYFGDIARLSSADYVKSATQATDADLLDDALCQIWRNSEIVQVKFARTQRAFFLTCAAAVLWLAFLLALTIRNGALPALGGAGG